MKHPTTPRSHTPTWAPKCLHLTFHAEKTNHRCQSSMMGTSFCKGAICRLVRLRPHRRNDTSTGTGIFYRIFKLVRLLSQTPRRRWRCATWNTPKISGGRVVALLVASSRNIDQILRWEVLIEAWKDLHLFYLPYFVFGNTLHMSVSSPLMSVFKALTYHFKVKPFERPNLPRWHLHHKKLFCSSTIRMV